MPTTRRQRSRTQTRLHTRTQTEKSYKRAAPATSRSRSRSRRKSEPNESRTRSGRKYHPAEPCTRRESEQPHAESCTCRENRNSPAESQTRSGRKYHTSIEDNYEERRPLRSSNSKLRAVYAQELRRRITAIPIKDRHVPETDDLKALGIELKLRLATNCDIISENGKRGGKVKVMTIYSTHRFVPIWEINKQQDPSLLCEVKVKVKPQRLRNRW